jgi:hypothetical protein
MFHVHILNLILCMYVYIQCRLGNGFASNIDNLRQRQATTVWLKKCYAWSLYFCYMLILDSLCYSIYHSVKHVVCSRLINTNVFV